MCPTTPSRSIIPNHTEQPNYWKTSKILKIPSGLSCESCLMSGGIIIIYRSYLLPI